MVRARVFCRRCQKDFVWAFADGVDPRKELPTITCPSGHPGGECEIGPEVGGGIRVAGTVEGPTMPRPEDELRTRGVLAQGASVTFGAVTARHGILAMGDTQSSLLTDYFRALSESVQAKAPAGQTEEPVHNPMMAFWSRAVLYFGVLEQWVTAHGYRPRVEDYALIICDLGHSLSTLVGRHWNEEAKTRFEVARGTPPTRTPELLNLLAGKVPGYDVNMPEDREGKTIWPDLEDFLKNYFDDIVTHFEEAKYGSAGSRWTISGASWNAPGGPGCGSCVRDWA
jgi:hypothetical protein